MGLFNWDKVILQALRHHHNKQTTSQTTKHKLCWEKLGTSHDVMMIFAIGSFLERYVVKIANDYLNIKHARQISAKLIDF